MSFGSPLVRHNLVKIPSQNQVENYVQKEADHSCSNWVVVDVLRKGGGNLVGLSIDHSPEGQHESGMGHDADRSVSGSCSIAVSSHHEGKDVLEEEEQKRYHHSYFSPGQEDLNEEILNDEQNIEEDKDKERHVEGDIRQRPHKYDWAQQVDDKHNDEVPHEPAEVVLGPFHAHDVHTFPDFGFLLIQHDVCLPEIYEQKRQQSQSSNVIAKIGEEIIQGEGLLVFRWYFILEEIGGAALLNLKDSVIDKGVGSYHSLADLVFVQFQVDAPLFGYVIVSRRTISSIFIVADVEPQLVLVVSSSWVDWGDSEAYLGSSFVSATSNESIELGLGGKELGGVIISCQHCVQFSDKGISGWNQPYILIRASSSDKTKSTWEMQLRLFSHWLCGRRWSWWGRIAPHSR